MGEQEPITENKRFGHYLRRIREDRRLSLDAVEELSTGYPERITKSHLSRIENGQALPTFPRIFALSQIYGVPVSSLAERFEIEYKREMVPAQLQDKPDDEVLAEAARLRLGGLHREALMLYEALLERLPARSPGDPHHAELRLQRANCLVQLSRFASAKEECEDLLSLSSLSPRQKVLALQYFAMCCYRMGKFTVAVIAIDRAQAELQGLESTDELYAHLLTLKGRVLVITGRHVDAIAPYREAVQMLERIGSTFELCRARINLADALFGAGQAKEASRHLNAALGEAEDNGYERLRALALSNLAELAFGDGNLQRAEAQLLLSNAIARPREFVAVVFRNCYFLWKIAQQRDDMAGIKANERALRTYLSRVDEHLPEARAYRAYLTGGDA